MQINLTVQSSPWLALILLIASCLFSCQEIGSMKPPPPAPELTPRAAYLEALHYSGLGESQLVQAWKDAAQKALEDSVEVAVPFKEIGFFDGAKATAFSYRIALKKGEQLQLQLETEPHDKQFFLELFQEEIQAEGPSLKHVFHSEPNAADSLVFEVPQDGIYLLRLQAEVLLSARFTLSLYTQPVYGMFPVSGKGNQDVWSFFGAPRDGGKRKHKGVDIFARRGTPVVAAMDGVVRRVRDRGLGGKQVWLSDRQRNQSLYYAHLDSQLVVEDERVKAGDTLGWVGNTGNAKNTRPHLHFSIYRRGSGAIDPYPFIARQSKRLPRLQADTSYLGQLVRVKFNSTRLRSAPNTRSGNIADLPRYLPLQILAASKDWYRVSTPNGDDGYVRSAQIETLNRAIAQRELQAATTLLQHPDSLAIPAALLTQPTQVQVIGQMDEFQLVVGEAGEMGWVMDNG